MNALPSTIADPTHLTLAFYLIAGLCVILIGIDKTGFGGGLGTLATPLLSLVISPLVAVGFLLPIFCVCDLFAMWSYRSVYDRRNLKTMIPGALLGIAAGGFFLWIYRNHKDQAAQILRMTIGLISLIFVVIQVARGWLLAHLPPSQPRDGVGAIWGWVAGFTSTLAHAGGPPVTIYLLPQRMDRRLFVGTTVWFFALVNYAKLIPYAALGMIRTDSFKTSLMLLPLVPVGILLGLAFNRNVRQDLFLRIVLVILFLTGLQLLSGWNILDLLHLR